MKHKLNEREWLDEFNQFISSEGAPVPQNISEKILKRTHSWMNPSAWLVFLKLLGVHSVIGTLSLAICNQFGLNPFNTKLSLAEYFMTFGHSVCMVLCGVIFVSFSLVVSWIILSRDEFSTIKKNVVIQIFSLSLLSLAVMAAFGAHLTLGIALLWLLGAFLGGALPAWTLSRYRIQHV